MKNQPQKQINIIIIADNPLFAEMLKKTMVTGLKENAAVLTMSSADAFFHEIESARIDADAIVLDYELNEKPNEAQSCKNVIDKIKRLSPETPIIVISDEKHMELAAKTLQYGANEYVIKDKFAFSHITNAVNSVLHPSRS
jgi:DNA-binding NarL/FixJ family response regulator